MMQSSYVCMGLFMTYNALVMSELSVNSNRTSEDDLKLNSTVIPNDTKISSFKSTIIPIERPIVPIKAKNSTASGILSSPIKDEIGTVWCYCNFPECVPKGYMCESSQGGCFTKNHEQTAHSHSSLSDAYISSNAFIRGCIESLELSDKPRCLSQMYPTKEITENLLETYKDLTNKNYLQQESDLQCCNQDVCNYEVSQPIFIVRKNNDDSETPMSLSNQFAWFKMTTIVVSVCGLCILIILLFFAGRMLKTDEKRNNSKYRNGGASGFSKPAYYFERTLESAENGSILCAKTLQRDDHPSMCSLPQKSNPTIHHHPFVEQSAYNSTKFYLSSPISGASCSTISSSLLSTSTRTCDFDLASQEEIEPLTRPQRHSEHIDTVLLNGTSYLT